MESTQELAQRIDSALAVLDDECKQIQESEMREYKERQERMARLATVFKTLTDAVRPRLELLIQRFGKKVIATPNLNQSAQEITLSFQSELARIDLRFRGATDHDITKVILSYDLRIVPALMHFDPHADLEMPLDAIDLDAAVRWTDERIVSFLHTYIGMHQNQYYLRDQMVADPVTGATFPKFAAAAKLERRGHTFFFVSDESRRAFEQQGAPAAG